MSESYDKTKHLEFIQQAISRMAHNSFMCKGWAITLFAALEAINGDKWQFLIYAIPEFVALLAFWYLDAYYLSLERLFRELYEDVRTHDFTADPYSMKTGVCGIGKTLKAMLSISEFLLYLTLIIFISWRLYYDRDTTPGFL
ncbi:MAG: hypothetical protein LBU13_10655 [Synergistaceae bacterium]|jgi:hypothetical protein|nr:hypothetical protein [Synergistaceae bacterium]